LSFSPFKWEFFSALEENQKRFSKRGAFSAALRLSAGIIKDDAQECQVEFIKPTGGLRFGRP
jgi:hypothetical protein